METIKCEVCGRTVSKADATYYEGAGIYVRPDCAEEEDLSDHKDDGVFVTCERCGNRILCDDAWPSYNGYLCDCCHDDLFG